ncbi:MAG: alpha/beta fold hydrolase [Clostridiales bacterium]|nr:alpha/beta fold hydrolase [Clostridiales bacterium]
MKTIEFDSVSGPGKKAAGFIYPVENSKATIQICHGMAEYIERYEELIKVLNDAGYTVCGIDMQGHGKTYALNRDPLGFFGEGKDAYKSLMEDNLIFHDLVAKTTGQSPQILYGHSMGSFVVRAMYSDSRYSINYDAFIIGSTKGHEPIVSLGIAVARFLCLIGRSRKKGGLLSVLAFGSYNKKVPKKRTAFDWLSVIDKNVDEYIEDPLCGFLFTNKGYYDMFRLIKFMQSKEAMDNLCKKPCLFLYGDDDPVGSFGKGVKKVIEEFKAHEVPVEEIDFGPYRHELMREPIKEDYFKAVLDYVKKFS